MVRAEVVSKDVGAKENGAKTWVVREYSPTHPKVKIWNRHIWIGWQSLGSQQILFTSFPNHLLKNAWVKFAFPYALSPYHEEAKRNTIMVIGGASAKLPHCTGHALTYSMENKMPLVHHAIEWWGCIYINKDDKGLSERTWRHPMLKPKSKSM